jgi:hypothetical protein
MPLLSVENYMRKLMIAAVAAGSLLTAASAANAAANHPGRHRSESQPSSRTGENPPYGMGWIATTPGWVYYPYPYYSYSYCYYDIFGVLWCY